MGRTTLFQLGRASPEGPHHTTPIWEGRGSQSAQALQVLAHPAVPILHYAAWAALQTQGIDRAALARQREELVCYPGPLFTSPASPPPAVSSLLWSHQTLLWLPDMSFFSEPSPVQVPLPGIFLLPFLTSPQLHTFLLANSLHSKVLA